MKPLMHEIQKLDEVSGSNNSTELPSSQVRTNQPIQLNLLKFNHNNNDIKL